MKALRMVLPAAMLAAVIMAGAGPAWAAVTGAEQLTLVFRYPVSGPPFVGTAAATGPVNGAGTVSVSPDGTGSVSLAQGTLRFTRTTLLVQVATDPQTCIETIAKTGTLQVTGGSGVFDGDTGSGTSIARSVLLLPRNPDHSCDFETAPIGGVQVVQAEVHLS